MSILKDILGDIGISKTVELRGKKIEVCGVGSSGLGLLAELFPEVAMVLEGDSAGLKSLEPERVAQALPQISRTIAALGIINPDSYLTRAAWKDAVLDEAVVIGRLGAHEQMQLFLPVWEQTFPEGVGPFVQTMAAVSKMIGFTGAEKIAEEPQQQKTSEPKKTATQATSGPIRMAGASPSKSRGTLSAVLQTDGQKPKRGKLHLNS